MPNFIQVLLASRERVTLTIWPFPADNIVCLGTHLPVPITGANHLIWCSDAVKSLINIDVNELIIIEFNSIALFVR